MPQCPVCNAAIWLGQEYCTICDQPLRPPAAAADAGSEGGLRPAGPEAGCQQSENTAAEMAETPLTTPAQTGGSRYKAPIVFLAAGLLGLVVLLVFLIQNSPEPGKTPATPPSQAVLQEKPATAPLRAVAVTPTVTTVAAVREVPAPPSEAAPSPAAGTAAPPAPRYVVTVLELSVREQPNMDASRIAILRQQDEVELLETVNGWGKVRDSRRNLEGWSYLRYLQPLAAETAPKASPNRLAAPQEAESLTPKDSKEM